MQGWIVYVAASCTIGQNAWIVGALGYLTIVLRCMVDRWGTEAAAEGVGARVGSEWQACYRSEHSARRNTTVGDITTQGKVSGFFGHADGGTKEMSRREESRRRHCCTRSRAEAVMYHSGLIDGEICGLMLEDALEKKRRGAGGHIYIEAWR